MQNKIKNSISPTLLIAFSLFFFFGLFNTANAAPCHSLDSTKPIPARFGASYNFFSGNNETLLTTNCNTDSLNISVGNGSPTTYIWNRAYYWRNNAWEEVILNGAARGDWIIGRGSAVINNISAGAFNNTNYYIAYTCDWNGSRWRCGCVDAACGSNLWQQQRFSSGTSPLPTTCSGNEIVVDTPVSADTINVAILNATPGDCVIIPDGTYTNLDLITIPANIDGTPGSEIGLQAETPGGVTFSRSIDKADHLMDVHGDHWIIRDFKIVDFSRVGDTNTYGFRVDGNNVRVTNNFISGFGLLTDDVKRDWVMWFGNRGVGGANCRVDHNTFDGNEAVHVVMQGPSAINCRVDHNHFKNSLCSAGSENCPNGHEGIYVGGDSFKYDMNAIVEFNIFENMGAEGETISNKGDENIYRNNVFLSTGGNSAHGLVLRGGSDCEIYNNYFLDLIGYSVTVYGGGHNIYNNYIQNPGYGAFKIQEANNINYQAVSDILVANNTVVGANSRGILISWPDHPVEWSSGATYTEEDSTHSRSIVARNGEEYHCIQSNTGVEPGIASGWQNYWAITSRPDNITIINNIIEGAPQYALIHDYGHTNGVFRSNILYDNSNSGKEWKFDTSGPNTGIPEPTGFDHVNPNLTLRGNYYGLQSSSLSAIGRGTVISTLSYRINITDDIEGNSREGGLPDIGADEYMDTSPLNLPVTENEVGPTWMQPTAAACEDGATALNQCSTVKGAPWYCNNAGLLVEYCDECECRNDWICSSAGTYCEPPPDTTLPIVNFFTSSPPDPITITLNESITFNYSIHDETELAEAILYQAIFNVSNCNDTNKLGCLWRPITSRNHSDQDAIGSFDHSPGVGTYFYGLHAVDTSNNHGHEVATIKTTVNPAIAGTAYYADDLGTDDSDCNCTDLSPCSASKCQECVNESETIVFKDGDYTGFQIRPPANSVTYTAQNRWGAKITGSHRTVYLFDDDNIILDGLWIDNEMNVDDRVVWVTGNSNNFIMKNCKVTNAGLNAIVGLTDTSSGAKILNNFFDDPMEYAIFESGLVNTEGNTIDIGANAGHAIIEGNTIINSHGHFMISSYMGDNIVIRNNILFQNGNPTGPQETHDGVIGLVRGVKYALIEGNIIYDEGANYGDYESGGIRAESCEKVVIRNNKIRNMDFRGIYISPGDFYRARYIGVYHNSLWQVNKFPEEGSSGYPGLSLSGAITINRRTNSTTYFPNNIRVLNNIIDNTSGSYFTLHDDVDNSGTGFVNITIENNLVFGRDESYSPTSGGSGYFSDAIRFRDMRENIGNADNDWPEFTANIHGNPDLADPANDDWNISFNSPAKDSSTQLTQTSSAGTGQSIPVDHPWMFYDGFGINGEVGDTIYVDNVSLADFIAIINTVDYQNNRLILNTSYSWENNAKIYHCPDGVCFSGDRPDIGAYEYGAATPADTTFPTVTEHYLTYGSVESHFTVSDSGGSHLDRIELWRAPHNSSTCNNGTETTCDWNEVTGPRRIITDLDRDDYTSSITSDPLPATYWYGIHAVDQAENCVTEQNKDCEEPYAQKPGDSFGPDEAIVTTVCTLSPGDSDYCKLTTCGPCAAGEGDCDVDAECESGLICPQVDGTDTCAVSAGTQMDKTGNQWYPYLEWSLANSSYSGNPYDLIATVAYTHTFSGTTITAYMFYDENNTWKFRFTGTKTGEWTFITSSSDSDLNNKSGTITINENSDPEAHGFVKAIGNKWAWEGTEKAFVPQFVMAKPINNYYNDPDLISTDIDEYVHGHGFTGFHFPMFLKFVFMDTDKVTEADLPSLPDDPNPDRRTFIALEKVIAQTHAAGGATYFWIWGADSGTRAYGGVEAFGGFLTDVHKRLYRYMAARLGPLPGWMCGYGWDVWEWTTATDLQNWYDYMKPKLGFNHFIGARAMRWNGEDETGTCGIPSTPYQFWTGGDFSSYETHRPVYQNYVNVSNQLSGKLSYEGDRFRIRTGTRYTCKDYDTEGIMTRRGLWHSTMAGGVGNTWGHLEPHNDNLLGSTPYPNKSQIKTYSTFIKNYFKSDMFRYNSITDGVCLKRPNNTDYVFYKEDTSSVRLDLSSMPSSQNVIAVDTEAAYSEINLGTMSATSHNWTAPYSSDWAIAVGFSSGDPIGDVVIISDDLTDYSTVGQRDGGVFTSEGYRPGTSNSGRNHISYDLESMIGANNLPMGGGYVEVELKGFRYSDVASGDSSFISMYDGRGISEPYYTDTGRPNYLDNFFRFNLHYSGNYNWWKAVINTAAPTAARLNAAVAEYEGDDWIALTEDRDWSDEPSGLSGNNLPTINFDQWYTLRMEWQGIDHFEAYLDNTLIWESNYGSYEHSGLGPFEYLPIKHMIYLGGGNTKYINQCDTTVYRNFKVVKYVN